MRDYETMLILPADADDAVIAAVTDRFTQVIGAGGGEVTHVDRWGRRRFAFPIGKRTEGFYLLVQMRAEPDAIKELDRVLSLADEVVRFKTVVLPDPSKRTTKAESERAAGRVDAMTRGGGRRSPDRRPSRGQDRAPGAA